MCLEVEAGLPLDAAAGSSHHVSGPSGCRDATREFSGPRAAGVQLISQDCQPVGILVLKGSEASFSGQDSLSFSFPEDVSPITPFLSTAWNTGSSSKGQRWLLLTQEAVHPGTKCSLWEKVTGLLPKPGRPGGCLKEPGARAWEEDLAV